MNSRTFSDPCLIFWYPRRRPPRFIPRSLLHSIACGRGSSSANSSRYVDMVLQLNDESTVEFSNILREELAVLNDYIHNVLIPAMNDDVQRNKNNRSPNKNAKNKTNDDTSDETDDEEAVEATSDEELDDKISDEEDEGFELPNGPSSDKESDDDIDETEDNDDDDDDDYVVNDEDNEDVAEVVEDEFANELAKKKRKGDSATESEEESGDRPRRSRRRLRD